MSFAAAALIEPLACVVWGIKRVQVQPGDSALVFGAGPMGCLVAQALKQAGAARVVITDPVPFRLEIAASLGLTPVASGDNLRTFAPSGYDIVTDATGVPAVIEQAFAYLRPRGKLWLFGVVPPDQRTSFIPYDVFRKDLTIIGSFAVNRTFSESIALIQSGAIQVEPLISHRLPLADFSRGFEVAEHDPQRMKVQFEI
jgi:2-desacetyl-2-hydroxyethyl bacteriochlorophyllide A dehydrogenase